MLDFDSTTLSEIVSGQSRTSQLITPHRNSPMKPDQARRVRTIAMNAVSNHAAEWS